MTNQPPQPKKQSYAPITLDDVRKLLDSKFVSAGVPSALVGIAINNAFQSKWNEAAKFTGAAALAWLIIKVLSKLTPKLDRLIDKLWDKAEQGVERTGIIPFKTQYLKALKTHCYAVEVEGFRGNLPRLPLKELFVPLRLDSDPDSTLSRQIIKRIWDLLPKENKASRQPLNSRLAIIAAPGYGKTTLTRYLTLSYADGSYRNEKAKELVPILLLFRSIHSQIQNETTPTLPDLITQQILRLPRCQHLQPKAEWIEGWLKAGKCLVMFDGLDEVPQQQREKVSKWANWQMQAYPTPFILTSRPHGFDSTLFQGIQPVKIEDFTNDQKSDFINKWYQSRIWEQWRFLYEESQHNLEEERLSLEQVKAQSQAEAQEASADLTKQLFAISALNELAKNPLLVTIIAATHEVFESLPKERTSLYRKILPLLLENRPNRRETRLTIPKVEENQAVLQVLALKLVEQNQMLQFTPEQAQTWIQPRLSECSLDSSLTPEKFLQEIQTIAGLLAGGTEEGGLYQFAHKTFQEYLAALEIKQQGQEHILIEKFYNPDWKEVICFYATLTNATPFLKLVLDNPPENDQEQKYALKLSYRLLEEGSKVDAEIKQRLERALDQANLGAELNAAIRLNQRFQNLTPIDDQTAISEPITWGEYQLFLNAQASGQFHSSAESLPVSPEQNNQFVTEISWQDARWFCAWLSTQASLQSEDIVYDYRLPSEEEMDKSARQGITPSTAAGDFLRVVRVEIPNHYQALLNYLANGRWREADEETHKVMLEVSSQQERGYLQIEDIEKFPCEDLRIINQLWLKFSNDHFGFSVQKNIWQECDSPREYGEDWKKFADCVGWRKEEGWTMYNSLTFDLSAAPKGQLPAYGWWSRREDEALRIRVGLFSRAKTCNL